MIVITIEQLDGSKITTQDIGLTVDTFSVSPPTLSHTLEAIDGRHGNIDLGSTLNARPIEMTGYIESYDKASFPMYRDRLFKAFANPKGFYLIDSRQPYKRWRAKLDGDWKADRVPFHNVGEVELSFLTMGLPYASSAATSLQPRMWQENGWWWGAGISWSDEDFVYNTTSFTVPNFGDVTVDPRFMEGIIRFNGASNNLRIRNLTTGDDWQYTGTTASNDQVTLEGVRSLKNGTSIVRNTNKQLISLAPGNNQFQITGATGAFTISFEFRFPYL